MLTPEEVDLILSELPDGKTPPTVWRTAAGLYAYARRSHDMFSWCGYVCVDEAAVPNVPLNYDHIDVNVHGGLTFGDEIDFANNDVNPNIEFTSDADKAFFVKNMVGKKYFWVGFDCAHYMDLVPGIEYTTKKMRSMRPAGLPAVVTTDAIESANPFKGTYKDFPFVHQECEELAKQLVEQYGCRKAL